MDELNSNTIIVSPTQTVEPMRQIPGLLESMLLRLARLEYQVDELEKRVSPA